MKLHNLAALESGPNPCTTLMSLGTSRSYCCDIASGTVQIREANELQQRRQWLGERHPCPQKSLHQRVICLVEAIPSTSLDCFQSGRCETHRRLASSQAARNMATVVKALEEI